MSKGVEFVKEEARERKKQSRVTREKTEEKREGRKQDVHESFPYTFIGVGKRSLGM